MKIWSTWRRPTTVIKITRFIRHNLLLAYAMRDPIPLLLPTSQNGVITSDQDISTTYDRALFHLSPPWDSARVDKYVLHQKLQD
jgi:hypothetical protein